MDSKRADHGNTAFLLAQVGASAATQFAERLSVLQLSPPDAGILRMLRSSAGISQQELSARLGIHPSRLVAILDNLQARNLMERKSNSEDRRLYSLHLTGAGREVLEQIGQIARQHQQALCAGLTGEERDTLTELLTRIAEKQGLVPGIHPGYRRLGEAPGPDATSRGKRGKSVG